MIEVREAREIDVEGIRDVFLAAYGTNYAYPQFYDLQVLKKLVFDDDTLVMVAEDTETQRILGTASIIFDIGAFGDLVGEFGRLVVHPDGRNRGIGKQLMEARLERAEGRLHLAIVENRVAHPFSQKISAKFGFTAAGLLPQKLLFAERESMALYFRHFEAGLKLRRNHPRLIPEACLLAQRVLSDCGLEPDVITDAESIAYPLENGFEIEEMTTRGYASLLRFERARMGHREILGPARIHQGLFQLKASDSHYVIAREQEQLIGAIGYAVDEVEKTATIFEIVTLDERPIRRLVDAVIRKCEDDFAIPYIEADVSSRSPRMQRTFLESRFLPVAYLPALGFSGAERCDAVRMARLTVAPEFEKIVLAESTRAVGELVMRQFAEREIAPQLAESLDGIGLFAGLTAEQAAALASCFSIKTFSEKTALIEPRGPNNRAFVILEGEVTVNAGRPGHQTEVGTVGAGDCLGETSLLEARSHWVEAVSVRKTVAAGITRDELDGLVRRRPDIGVILFRNLAESLGRKLRRLDSRVSDGDPDS